GVTEYVAEGRLPSWLPQLRYGRSILQWFDVGRDMKQWRPGVLHCTMFFPRPARAGGNMVPSVHDLHFVKCPHTFGRLTARAMGPPCRRGVRRAGRTLTLAGFSKRDMVRRCGARREKIDCVSLAVDRGLFRPPADPDEPRRFRERYRLPAEYLLFPANTHP